MALIDWSFHCVHWNRKSPADLFRRQDTKKTERGRN